MLLDQQVPMEWAFSAPYSCGSGWAPRRRRDRRDDPEAFLALFKGPPALHRFPGSMGKRTQALCQALVDDYGGDAAAVWAGVDLGQGAAGPGEGPAGLRHREGQDLHGDAGQALRRPARGLGGGHRPVLGRAARSVADIGSAEELAQVRAWKKKMKAAGKSKQDAPG